MLATMDWTSRVYPVCLKRKDLQQTAYQRNRALFTLTHYRMDFFLDG